MTNKPPIDRLQYEHAFRKQGLVPVAGIDEAGRGSLAGPVAAGAVILPLERDDLLEVLKDVRDSKLCTPLQRNELFDLVNDAAVSAACGMASAEEIDEHGIAPATRLAMVRAMQQLVPQPKALIIDYVRLNQVNLPQVNIKKGELHSLSIAAASIIAKVTRDRYMVEAADTYNGYDFASNKGYGTLAHRDALLEKGPCDIHRMTFAPVLRAKGDLFK